MSDTPTARPDEFWLGVFTTQARARLMQFIRAQADGGCKILSLGDECLCPRCDVDRLFTLLERTQAEREALREALAAIVSGYDGYRGRGMMPAPDEYRRMVAAIDDARDLLTAPASAAPATREGDK